MFISLKCKELASKLGSGLKKRARLSMMCQKQNGLATKGDNLEKSISLKLNKLENHRLPGRGGEKRFLSRICG
jgi:hypothetical protein